MPLNHIIGSGLTESELKAANFWARHRVGLTRLGYGSLVAFVSLTWLFSLWSVVDAYVISYPRESLIPKIIAQNNLAMSAFESTAPQSISPSEVLVFQTTDDRSDFIVELSNPNPRWWAEFTYSFDTGSEQTTAREGYILPNSPQTLTELGWKGKSQPVTAQLHVENIRWHRIDPEKVEKDYAAFAAKRLQFQIDHVTYQNDLKIDDHSIGQTNFTITNPSGYGYWDTELTIILYRTTSPIAVQKISVRELKPGESRPITVNWFENLAGIAKTDIRPSVKILDPNVFLPSDRF